MRFNPFYFDFDKFLHNFMEGKYSVALCYCTYCGAADDSFS